MAGLADGIKIVAVEAFVALPAATAIWGDWGAEVIKVEPLTGDPWRGFMGTGIFPFKLETSDIFDMDNRNKKSVALDLKTKEGKKILRQLIEGADIFCTNYAPDTLPKLSIDYESVSKVNPQIIYVNVNGYGETGPDKDLPGFDWTAYWSRSGIMMTVGDPGAPVRPRAGIGDHPTSMYVAGAMAAALLCRERTGIAQQVAVSLLHCGMWTLGCDLSAALASGQDIPRVSRNESLNPLAIPYQTKDEKWLFLVMLQSDAFWPQTCRALGKEELINDPRFANSDLRGRNGRALIAIFEKVFTTRTREEWAQLFKEHGVIFGLIHTCAEVVRDPQASEFIAVVDHPTRGKVRMIASPGQFSKTPAHIEAYAPEVGQHTEEILLELGYDWEEIVTLKDKKTIL